MPSRDIAIVMGTRPEMIKLSELIRCLEGRARIIHTGQHFDEKLSGQVQNFLNLPAPHVQLEGVGGKTRSEQISTGIAALAKHFSVSRPSVVVVQGDTNAVSAGAQAANYAGIPLVHVEAGLRSHDRSMPEEINRMVTGVLADVHCAATDENRNNLISEGVDVGQIALTANTIVEVIQKSLDSSRRLDPPFEAYKIPRLPYTLATIHRPENTDSPEALERVLSELTKISAPVLFVVHPRTRAAIERFELTYLTESLTLIDSVPHHELLALAQGAGLLISDSGGLQEECTVLKKPLLVVRKSTERQESIYAGFAQLITPEMSISNAANTILSQNVELSNVPSPYGDGLASVRIAEICKRISDGESFSEAITMSQTRFAYKPPSLAIKSEGLIHTLSSQLKPMRNSQ